MDSDVCSLSFSGTEKVVVDKLGDVRDGKLKEGINHVGGTFDDVDLSLSENSGDCVFVNLEYSVEDGILKKSNAYWLEVEKDCKLSKKVATASLIIDSTPQGADVYVNSETVSRGKTPLTLSDLSGGSYMIYTKLDSYDDSVKMTQEVKAGDVITLSPFELKAKPKSDSIIQYHFGEVGYVKDSSGNGNDGMAFSSYYKIPAWSGSAIKFKIPTSNYDYSGMGYVSYSGTATDELQKITIAALVKFESLSNNKQSSIQRLVSLGNEKAVLRQNNKGQLHFYMKIDGQTKQIMVDNIIEPEKMLYIVGTYDGANMKLYLNGEEKGNLEVAGTVDKGKGLTLSSNDAPFNGIIDEVEIYDNALSADQIKEKYASYYNSCVPTWTADEKTIGTCELVEADGMKKGRQTVAKWTDISYCPGTPEAPSETSQECLYIPSGSRDHVYRSSASDLDFDVKIDNKGGHYYLYSIDEGYGKPKKLIIAKSSDGKIWTDYEVYKSEQGTKDYYRFSGYSFVIDSNNDVHVFFSLESADGQKGYHLTFDGEKVHDLEKLSFNPTYLLTDNAQNIYVYGTAYGAYSQAMFKYDISVKDWTDYARSVSSFNFAIANDNGVYVDNSYKYRLIKKDGTTKSPEVSSYSSPSFTYLALSGFTVYQTFALKESIWNPKLSKYEDKHGIFLVKYDDDKGSLISSFEIPYSYDSNVKVFSNKGTIYLIYVKSRKYPSGSFMGPTLGDVMAVTMNNGKWSKEQKLFDSDEEFSNRKFNAFIKNDVLYLSYLSKSPKSDYGQENYNKKDVKIKSISLDQFSTPVCSQQDWSCDKWTVYDSYYLKDWIGEARESDLCKYDEVLKRSCASNSCSESPHSKPLVYKKCSLECSESWAAKYDGECIPIDGNYDKSGPGKKKILEWIRNDKCDTNILPKPSTTEVDCTYSLSHGYLSIKAPPGSKVAYQTRDYSTYSNPVVIEPLTSDPDSEGLIEYKTKAAAGTWSTYYKVNISMPGYLDNIKEVSVSAGKTADIKVSKFKPPVFNFLNDVKNNKEQNVEIVIGEKARPSDNVGALEVASSLKNAKIVLDSKITTPESKNLIMIGNECGNSEAARILGGTIHKGKLLSECSRYYMNSLSSVSTVSKGYWSDAAVTSELEKTTKILVGGLTSNESRRGALLLKNFDKYQSKLNSKAEFCGSSLNEIRFDCFKLVNAGSSKTSSGADNSNKITTAEYEIDMTRFIQDEEYWDIVFKKLIRAKDGLYLIFTYKTERTNNGVFTSHVPIIILKSTDKGKTWTKVQLIDPESTVNIVSYAISYTTEKPDSPMKGDVYEEYSLNLDNKVMDKTMQRAVFKNAVIDSDGNLIILYFDYKKQYKMILDDYAKDKNVNVKKYKYDGSSWVMSQETAYLFGDYNLNSEFKTKTSDLASGSVNENPDDSGMSSIMYGYSDSTKFTVSSKAIKFIDGTPQYPDLSLPENYVLLHDSVDKDGNIYTNKYGTLSKIDSSFKITQLTVKSNWNEAWILGQNLNSYKFWKGYQLYSNIYNLTRVDLVNNKEEKGSLSSNLIDGKEREPTSKVVDAQGNLHQLFLDSSDRKKAYYGFVPSNARMDALNEVYFYETENCAYCESVKNMLSEAGILYSSNMPQDSVLKQKVQDALNSKKPIIVVKTKDYEFINTDNLLEIGKRLGIKFYFEITSDSNIGDALIKIDDQDKPIIIYSLNDETTKSQSISISSSSDNFMMHKLDWSIVYDSYFTYSLSSSLRGTASTYDSINSEKDISLIYVQKAEDADEDRDKYILLTTNTE